MAEPDGWGVFVDEVKLCAIGGDGAEWWTLFWRRFEPAGRIAMLVLSIAGGHWHVACDSKADAAALVQLMTARGVHPKCVKVATLSACRKAAADRQAREDAHLAAVAAIVEAGREEREAWAWWVGNVLPDALTDPAAAGVALAEIGYPATGFMQPVMRAYQDQMEADRAA